MKPQSLLKLLLKDFERERLAHNPTPHPLKILLFHTGFHLALLHRTTKASRQVPIIGSLLKHIFQLITSTLRSCEIAPDATIAAGIRFPHPLAIVIGPCTIGENCTIFQQVTIGRSHTNDDAALTSIGHNVTIYAGAKIIGSVSIGDNAIIGANAVVTKNVPPNNKAVGVPAHITPLRIQK